MKFFVEPEYWKSVFFFGDIQMAAALALGFSLLFIFSQISALGFIGALKNQAGLLAIMLFPPALFIISGFLIYNLISTGFLLKSWEKSPHRILENGE